MALQLDGPKSGQLQNILESAFDPDRFSRMLLHKLNLKVFAFVPINATWSTMVDKTIERTNQNFITDKLIAAARETNPTNVDLYEFSRQYGLTSLGNDKTTQEFERIVVETSNFLNPASWRTKLATIENQVCRIEIKSNGNLINGTGFLLGTNVVLTNYHVIEAVIKGERNETTDAGLAAKASDVICRFDYKRSADMVLNRGVTYNLAPNWLIDYSENFPLDQEDPPKDRLDYALLRLQGTPGRDIIGDVNNPVGEPRGWIDLPADSYGFITDSPILIMQHPKGGPLKLALATNGIIEVNLNQTRVKHRVNTENGSSGSPCFSQNWELIALHHSGDPDFAPDHKPSYNEAIPIAAILDLMTHRGVDQFLGV